MTNRITKKLVTFGFPFRLDEIDEELPPGGYTIETEEQSLDGMNFIAHRRVETVIVIRSVEGLRKSVRYISIDPGGLDTALARDRALADASREHDAIDDASLQRAENEGMRS